MELQLCPHLLPLYFNFFILSVMLFWTLMSAKVTEKETVESPWKVGEIFNLCVHVKRQFTSVTLLCPTLCDPMDCSTPRPPCPSPTPGAYSNSCPSVGDAIQPSHPLSSPSPLALNLSQHQGLFQWVSSSHQVAKVLEFQLQHQSFQWLFRTDFLYDGLVGFPCSPRDFQESSLAPQFKSINSSVLTFFIVQLSHPYIITEKTIALTGWTFVGKVMSLLFNMLFTLIIVFLSRSKHLFIS